jgi:hypothetical protein
VALGLLVAALVVLQTRLAQFLPLEIQKYLHEKINDAVETYLSSECDLSGDWSCTNSPPCQNPPDHQASIQQDRYKLFFNNERNDPRAGGVWIKPRLVFVPRFDPDHGGAFGEISRDCKKIDWSNKEHTIWEKKSP